MRNLRDAIFSPLTWGKHRPQSQDARNVTGQPRAPYGQLESPSGFRAVVVRFELSEDELRGCRAYFSAGSRALCRQGQGNNPYLRKNGALGYLEWGAAPHREG